ncbi:MAG: hypothetical protein LBU32_17700, partial [Clostridiales bacterium]|nr:hypothetical protein [Clostridiales bacterium]
MFKEREGWSFKVKEEACEGVPAEAEALPEDPGAGIGAYLEISGRIDGKEGKDIAPVPEPVDLAQRRAGEIKRDGADFAEAAADLRKKAEELEDSRQKGKAGRSPACMAAIATAAIFRGCRGFSGFAAFAKADGAWLERR